MYSSTYIRKKLALFRTRPNRAIINGLQAATPNKQILQVFECSSNELSRRSPLVLASRVSWSIACLLMRQDSDIYVSSKSSQWI
jgi:hypothetical protein